MDFHDGLNVIVGTNNSGKTGLLKAICLIQNPKEISIDDFNKNNLRAHYNDLYKNTPPQIVIEYHIEHQISEEDTADESIIKLLPFIGMDKINESKDKSETSTKYSLIACVKMAYTFNSKDKGLYEKEMSKATSFEGFFAVLKRLWKSYEWKYTNGISDTSIDEKDVKDIFKIDFIDAERNNEVVYSETKKEIEDFLKNDEQGVRAVQEMQKVFSDQMKDTIKPVLTKISALVENEHNEIGLAKGNVAIAQDLRPAATISSAYVIDVKDTKSNSIMPLKYNGLGYNNLINMYMLIKLVEIQKGRDFRILCLEEPEAHLHPAMQYKLFKFLKKLDTEDNLNQQIFVTTHSSNITAVAGLDNMYMLAYDRCNDTADCIQRRLSKQFEQETDEKHNKELVAKKHLMKFLDVTRSDMLFADKVIFVEGIAEKLLLPKFMNSCDYSYEDEHIAIVEIGGKHFDYFLKAFYRNPVRKKILCITDSDFEWITGNKIKSILEYEKYTPNHFLELKTAFLDDDNIHVSYQKGHGSTFEDELFLSNFEKPDIAIKLLKIALSESLSAYIDDCGLDYAKWTSNRDKINERSRKRISTLLDLFDTAIKDYSEQRVKFEHLFFAKLFLSYAKNKKGDVALSILVDDELISELIVPEYIKEGILWLSR